MKRIVFIILTLATSIFALLNWFQCRGLTDQFILSRTSIPLRLDDYIHNDKGLPFFLIRLLHNKGTEYVIDSYRHFVRFMDIPFLVSFLSIIGVVGLCFGVYYTIRQRNKILLVITCFLLLLQLCVVHFGEKINSIGVVLMLWLLYESIALYGLLMFVKGKKLLAGYGLWFVLLFLSVWWISIFGNDIFRFCAKI